MQGLVFSVLAGIKNCRPVIFNPFLSFSSFLENSCGNALKQLDALSCSYPSHMFTLHVVKLYEA